jgi:hypothetical protein
MAGFATAAAFAEIAMTKAGTCASFGSDFFMPVI